MSTKATELAKAFYHDEISDDKLEYFASGGEGKGAQFHNGDFDLDVQKDPHGRSDYWVLAIHINEHTSRKTLVSVKREAQNGNHSSGSATPVVAQVLVPDYMENIKAQDVRAALDVSMEGVIPGVVNNVKLMSGGNLVIKYHPLYDADQQGGHVGASQGTKRKGKAVKGSRK